MPKICIVSILILFLSIALQAQDSNFKINNENSLAVDVKSDTLSEPGLQEEDPSKKRKKIKVVRRKFNFRNQVGTALGMMLFVTIILFSVQNWNPD